MWWISTSLQTDLLETGREPDSGTVDQNLVFVKTDLTTREKELANATGPEKIRLLGENKLFEVCMGSSGFHSTLPGLPRSPTVDWTPPFADSQDLTQQIRRDVKYSKSGVYVCLYIRR